MFINTHLSNFDRLTSLSIILSILTIGLHEMFAFLITLHNNST